MASENHLLEIILRECRSKAPAPFYPSVDGKDKFERTALDAALDQLRMGGLLQLTPWEAGRGQGYTLTAAGEELLQSPRALNRLQTRGVEAPPAQPAPSDRTNVQRPITAWDKGEAIRAILTGGRRPTVTMTILFLNVAVFLMNASLAMQNNVPIERFMSGVKADPTGLGMVRPDIVAQAEWWRLLTYQFIHIGGWHLLFNMLFLYNVGPVVETMFGHWRFLLLYLISGLGGGAGMVLAHSGGAGASGSLCGIFAAMAVFLMWNRAHLPPQVVASSMRQIAINAMIIVFISMLPDVSGSGHLGGAIAGAVVCVPLMYTLFGNAWQRWLGWLAVVAAPFVCTGVLHFSVTEDERAEWALHGMIDAEKKAAEVYNTVIVDLLSDPENFVHNEKRKAQAKAAIAQAAHDLRSADVRLKSTGPFGSVENQRKIADARKYLENWQAMLAASEKCLASNDGGSPKQHREVRDQLDQLTNDALFKQRFKRN